MRTVGIWISERHGRAHLVMNISDFSTHVVRNLWSGLRLALFQPVQRSNFRTGLLLASFGVVTNILLVSAASYFEQEYEVFVNIYGALSLVIITFTLFLVAIAYARSQDSLEMFPDLLTLWAFASPFMVIVALVVLGATKEYAEQGSALMLLSVWSVWIARRGVLLVFPAASNKSQNILGIGLVVFSSLMWAIGLVPVLFFSYDNESYDDYFSIDQEKVYFSQAELLENQLSQVEGENPGIIDLYFIGFAGNGDESVFQSEAEFAASAIDQKYGTHGRAIVLSNDSENLSTKPLANSYNLYETIQRFGEKMNVAEDLLFVFLTSHGSSNATIDVSLYPFGFKPVSAEGLKYSLDQSGVTWRIIVVSACYSGSFIETLQDERTAIFTAAAADKTSFGCSNQRELTYFGEAFFKESLAQGSSLEASFNQALTLISERESSESRAPSNPKSYIGNLIRPKLAELEALSQN